MESLLAHFAGMSASSVTLTVAGILLLCGLGMPLPEDIPLITAGYLAHTGVVDVHPMFVVCFASVLAGDTMAFFMGRWFGQRVLASRLARRFFTPRKQMRIRAYFRKYGSKVVFIGRFVPGLRFTIYFTAGTLHLRTAVFFVYDSLAALISVPLLVYAAWYFGEYIDKVLLYARRGEHGILVIVLVAAGIFALRAWRKRKKAVSASASAPPPDAPPPGVP